jgi:hypothetical protein
VRNIDALTELTEKERMSLEASSDDGTGTTLRSRCKSITALRSLPHGATTRPGASVPIIHPRTH